MPTSLLFEPCPIPVLGPVCAPWYDDEYTFCSHTSCLAAAETAVPAMDCATHGPQQITREDSTAGFCAGTVFFTVLACGCTLMEDCSYLES